jgi:hypothetical protein
MPGVTTIWSDFGGTRRASIQRALFPEAQPVNAFFDLIEEPAKISEFLPGLAGG